MSTMRRIGRFLLWQVKPGMPANKDLFAQLVVLMHHATSYLDIPAQEDYSLPRQMSFLEAIRFIANLSHVSAIDNRPELLSLVNVPAIARDRRNDRPVVLIPYGPQRMLMIDGLHNTKEILTQAELRKNVDEIVLLFFAPSQAESHRTVAKSLTSFMPTVSLFFVLLTALISGCAFLGAAFALLSDYGAKNRFGLILGCAFVSLFFFLAGRWSLYEVHKNQALVRFAITYDFLRRFFSLPYELFAQFTPQNFALHVQKIIAASTDFFARRFRLITSSLFLFILASFFIVDGRFTIIVSLLYGGLLLLLLSVARESQRVRVREQHARDELTRDFERFAIGMLAMKGLHVSAILTQAIRRKTNMVQHLSLRAALLAFVLDASFLFVPVTSAVLFCAWYGFQGTRAILAWQLLWWSALSLMMGVLFVQFVKNARAVRAIPTDHDVIDSIDGLTTVQKTRVEPVHIEGTFELINASFHYENSPLVIKNKNLVLEKNQFHILRGPSGVGKSTLLKMLMGMLTPTEGQVVIDGQDMRSLNLGSLRRYFGVVLTDSALFSGSVFDNIMCGRAIPNKNLEHVLLSHEIFDYLIDLPMGLETYIYWHAKNVSRLEKTLILLARALVHQPKILFVDELLHDLPRDHRILLEQYLSSLSITRVVTSHAPLISSVSHHAIELLAHPS